jgi:hypothetical protein
MKEKFLWEVVTSAQLSSLKSRELNMEIFLKEEGCTEIIIKLLLFYGYLQYNQSAAF